MLTNEMIATYEELTEHNHHGELLETIAADLKLFRYKKVFQSINIIHDTEGHLMSDLRQVRDRYKNYLKDYIIIHLPEAESKILLEFV